MQNIEKSGGPDQHHAMPFGYSLLPEKGVRFRLWAPGAENVQLCLISGNQPSPISPMEAVSGWWFQHDSRDAVVGTLYQFRINDDLLIPDPASRFQPEDIHGPSQIISAADFDWQNSSWRGRPWEEVILYELHVGTFSPEGTFAGVEARLDYLADLGVTALELMPIADFPGRFNWGYDGALLFAPDSVYGHPDDLRRLVRTAHQKGLMVFLDVVYNHFGPEGNYLHVYARQAFFQQDIHTPWGAAINFSGPGSRTVRDFFIHNALYWLEEFQLDGLRFDAVHGIYDDSQRHILEEIAEAVAGGPGRERHIHLVLENDNNEAHFLKRNRSGVPVRYKAQWNDDIHHALHVLITGEEGGYYRDYADKPAEHLGRCLAEGFAYQGEPSAYRNGRPRGEPSRLLPPTAFVSFLQNHDQVGNRALGERITSLARERNIRLAVALLLLAPSPPLLFMGEEFFAQTPFCYFCDFEGELAREVTAGRRREFARFPQFADPEQMERIPDPTSPETVVLSSLNWQHRTSSDGRRWHAFYKKLFELRKQYVIPRLQGIEGGKAGYRAIGPKAVNAWWTVPDGSQLRIMVNFAEKPVENISRPEGLLFYADPEKNALDWQDEKLSALSILCFLDRRRISR